jgi:lipid-A-disaccharide synthase
MKLFCIAGERSGDLHGSNLIRALKTQEPNLLIQAWGGNLMEAAGATLLKNYESMAFMGLVEVLKNLGTIRKNLELCKKQILAFAPNCVVLIDYGGFNLKIAEFCYQNNIKVSYYITPKVWAWNTSRALKLKKWCNQLLVILPFEVDFFKRYQTASHYVGNPLMDELASFRKEQDFLKNNQLANKPIIALLAGSRTQEIKNMLPAMLLTASHFPNFQFVIAGVDNISAGLYQQIIGSSNIKIIYGQTYQLLSHAQAALVTSGTATLETALLKCPQVVLYKTNAIQFHLGKLLLKIKYISLVNLINNNLTVVELLQEKCKAAFIQEELKAVLPGGTKHLAMLQNYQVLAQKVGNAGASERAATHILQLLTD